MTCGRWRRTPYLYVNTVASIVTRGRGGVPRRALINRVRFLLVWKICDRTLPSIAGFAR